MRKKIQKFLKDSKLFFKNYVLPVLARQLRKYSFSTRESQPRANQFSNAEIINAIDRMGECDVLLSGERANNFH